MHPVDAALVAAGGRAGERYEMVLLRELIELERRGTIGGIHEHVDAAAIAR
jgi:hypothetical protein